MDDFDWMLDEYQATLAEAAEEAADRSHVVAARPDAIRAEVPFHDLRPGDYITNEPPGGRWVRVVEVRGPCCYVRSRRQAVADGLMSVLFEVPESVVVSGETRYWIDRPLGELVTVDFRARGLLEPRGVIVLCRAEP